MALWDILQQLYNSGQPVQMIPHRGFVGVTGVDQMMQEAPTGTPVRMIPRRGFIGTTGWDQLKEENPLPGMPFIGGPAGVAGPPTNFPAGTMQAPPTGLQPGVPFPGTGAPPLLPEFATKSLLPDGVAGAIGNWWDRSMREVQRINQAQQQQTGDTFRELQGKPNMSGYAPGVVQPGISAPAYETQVYPDTPSKTPDTRTAGADYSGVQPGLSSPRVVPPTPGNPQGPGNDGAAGAPALGGSAAPAQTPENGKLNSLMEALSGLQAPAMRPAPQVSTPPPPTPGRGGSSGDLLKAMLAAAFAGQQGQQAPMGLTQLLGRAF